MKVEFRRGGWGWGGMGVYVQPCKTEYCNMKVSVWSMSRFEVALTTNFFAKVDIFIGIFEL